MACEMQIRKEQTLEQRKDQIREAMKKVLAALVNKRVSIKVGKNGGIAFSGLTEEERADMTDACIYRRIMASNNTLAKMAVAQAEQIAGRQVDRVAVAHGLHSHDGGQTWHNDRRKGLSGAGPAGGWKWPRIR